MRILTHCCSAVELSGYKQRRLSTLVGFATKSVVSLILALGMKRSKTCIHIQYTVLALLLFAILFLLRAVPEQKVETAVLKKLEAKEFDSNVYYKHTYWNDIPLVAKEVQRRMTGSEDLSWTKFLLQKRGKPFSRALSINSGNGWVERQLMRDGVILSGVGTDLFQNFVDEMSQNFRVRNIRRQF